MGIGNVAVKRSRFDIRWVVAVLAALLALACAVGAGLAWASPDEGSDVFAEVSDVAAPSDGAEADASSQTTLEQQSDDKGDDPDGDVAAGGEETSPKATEADGDEDGDEPVWAFAKNEYTVEVGGTVLVGFAPAKSDADSEDAQRAEWYGDWSAAVRESNVDVSPASGWLVPEVDGEKIDYDGIVGITTSDKAAFELFGEFPEWKVGDDDVEYRWWYGLLGSAKKPGDVKLSIMCNAPDGGIDAISECTVHIVERKKGDMTAQSVDEPTESAESASSPSDAAVSTQSADEEASSDSSNSSDASAAAQSAQTGTSSGLTSKSSVNGGSGLSSKSSTAESSQSTNTAYPKEIATTVSGSKYPASLLANDAASEEAFAKLAGSGKLSLAVDLPAKLGDEAEASITTLAKTGNLEVAERLSVTVVDEQGKAVPISGMNLTVRVAADDAVKALDASSMQVWYVATDGSTEKKEAKVDGDQLSISTEHLSDFAVLGAKSSSSGTGVASTGSAGLSSGSSSKGLPQTGDSLAYLAVLLAFVAGFSASSALNARRRLREMPFDFGQRAA